MRVLVLLAASCFASATAFAAYPDRPIRLIMPYPAGGSIDTAGRAVAQKLAEHFGQQIVIDNRTGSGGTIGTETAARAAPDGYTLVMGGTGTLALSPHLQRNLPYDSVRDFTPVTMLIASPYVLVVHPSVPANSVKELIALAKARPGQIDYASGGNGSAPHFASEMFNAAAGVKLTHIPYKGAAPAMTDMIGGQIQFLITSPLVAMPQGRAGRIKVLATTGAQRDPLLPELPTMAETVPGYEIVQWWGISVAKATPAAISQRLHKELMIALNVTEVKALMNKNGATPQPEQPAEFAAFMRSERARIGNVGKQAGITID